MMILTPAQIEQHRQERAEKRDIFVKENSKGWAKTGKKYKKMRQTLRLTLREMSDLTGFSASKLGAFEQGNPILNRSVVEKSYLLVIRIMAMNTKSLTDEMVAA